jgi:hypothetical protein
MGFFLFEFFYFVAFDLCGCVPVEGVIAEMLYSKGMFP